MADRPLIFLLVTALVLLTVLSIFAMKYFFAARQARLLLTSEETYRALAERAVNAHEETAAALASLKQSISDIGARLAGIEKVLKDVE